MRTKIKKAIRAFKGEEINDEQLLDVILTYLDEKSVQVTEDNIKIGDRLIRDTDCRIRGNDARTTRGSIYRVEDIRSEIYLNKRNPVALRADDGVLRWYKRDTIILNYSKVKSVIDMEYFNR